MIAMMFVGIALVLFIAEMAFLDFSCFVFALGFSISAVLAMFIPAPWWVFMLISCALSLVFFFTIKKPIARFFTAKKSKDNFLDDVGVGVVKNGMIYFKATLWEADIKGLSEGDEVKVLGIKDGKIIIEKVEF